MSHLYFLVKRQNDAVILDGASMVSTDTKKIGFTDCPDVWVNACIDDWMFLNDEVFDGRLFDECFLIPCLSNQVLTVDFGSMVARWKRK
jgi:hypothetical protein